MNGAKDDWEKTRTKGVHLSDAEISKLRIAFNLGRKARDVARELKCASRTVTKFYAQFRGDPHHRDRARKPVVIARPLNPITKESRFYKSSFEL